MLCILPPVKNVRNKTLVKLQTVLDANEVTINLIVDSLVSMKNLIQEYFYRHFESEERMVFQKAFQLISLINLMALITRREKFLMYMLRTLTPCGDTLKTIFKIARVARVFLSYLGIVRIFDMDQILN